MEMREKTLKIISTKNDEKERERDSRADGYERARRETNEWFKERKHFLKM